MANYYSSLLLSARHAHNLCNSRMAINKELLTCAKNRLAKLRSQYSNMILHGHINEYNIDQVLSVEQEIHELETIIISYESVISDLKQTANSILDIMTLLEKNPRKKYDYDIMLESCEYAIYLFKDKIALYQSKNAGYTTIIKNMAANSASNATPVNTSGLYMNIKYNERRINEIAHDISQMNTIINAISQHRELKAAQSQINNTEHTR